MTSLPHKHVFFDNLHGLRFLSFFYVFIAHSFPTDDPAIYNSLWYRIIKGKMFLDGEPGVSFFFVLSGFLITYLLLKEKEFTQKINLKAFYIRRILRIWPLYYFSVFFGFAIFPYLKEFFGGVSNENANVLLSSVFLNNFDRMINGLPLPFFQYFGALQLKNNSILSGHFYFYWCHKNTIHLFSFSS